MNAYNVQERVVDALVDNDFMVLGEDQVHGACDFSEFPRFSIGENGLARHHEPYSTLANLKAIVFRPSDSSSGSRTDAISTYENVAVDSVAIRESDGRVLRVDLCDA